MINGSFEGVYTPRPANEVRVAPGWEPFWSTGDPPEQSGPCQRPEYKAATLVIDPNRVVLGEAAQQWFIRWKVMDAGVFQVINNLPVNAPISFSASVQAWCSNKHDPRASDGELYFRLGLDLHGGTDPWSDTVFWTTWLPGTAEHQRFSLEANTLGPTVTVYVRAWNKWKLAHNDAYVDDARLDVQGQPGGGGLTEETVRRIWREEWNKKLGEIQELS